MIFVTPFEKFKGRTYSGVVTLADIMPTLLEMTGLTIPPEVQGKSLIRYFRGSQKPEDRLAYSETYYPRYHYGWSELRSFQNNRYKLIIAPVPELYDLKSDPDEQKNLVYVEKKVFEELTRLAEDFEKTAGEKAIEADFASVDEETREKLAALGYLGSFVDPTRLAGKKLADPKDKINIFNEISRARETGMAGNFDEAIAALRKILEEDPTISDGFFALGNVYFKARRFQEAVEAFTRALELKPDDSFAVINVANCYAALNKLELAEQFIQEQVKRGFDDPQFYHVLGTLYALRNNYDKALPYFEECLRKNPRSASAHNAIAAICLNRDNLACAEEHLRAARELNPTLLNLRYNLAQALRKAEPAPGSHGTLPARNCRFSQPLQGPVQPGPPLPPAAPGTGRTGNPAAGPSGQPGFSLTYFYIARVYLRRGERFQEAVDLVKKGLELKPDKENLPLGYFLLADLYNRLGDYATSEQYASKGRQLVNSSR